jgi:hypothetical protein
LPLCDARHSRDRGNIEVTCRETRRATAERVMLNAERVGRDAGCIADERSHTALRSTAHSYNDTEDRSGLPEGTSESLRLSVDVFTSQVRVAYIGFTCMLQVDGN